MLPNAMSRRGSVVVTTACKVRNLFGKYYLRNPHSLPPRGLQKLPRNSRGEPAMKRRPIWTTSRPSVWPDRCHFSHLKPEQTKQ